MPKYYRNFDLNQFDDESSIEQIKKKNSNPQKKHIKDKRRKNINFSKIDW